ncbi:hypothetical protein [Metabacillus idriensis]|uniref:hypothetical protein n=1 Tax=Metabacillus idriensis TaxID=324768 RepID=UPI003D284F8A
MNAINRKIDLKGKMTIWGLALQSVFILLITIFNPLRIAVMEVCSVYPVALFELFLGAVSLICGIYGLSKRNMPAVSVFVAAFGVLICFYFIFVYLLPEAGTPPPIPWLYNE